MSATILKNPIYKGRGARVYHRRLDSIKFDGEVLSATLRSTTQKGKGKTLFLDDEGWKQRDVDRYSLSINVLTGEFGCDCPQGSLGRACKHIERLTNYAKEKGWLK